MKKPKIMKKPTTKEECTQDHEDSTPEKKKPKIMKKPIMKTPAKAQAPTVDVGGSPALPEKHKYKMEVYHKTNTVALRRVGGKQIGQVIA